MFKKHIALILAMVVLVAALPVGMFTSAATETLPNEVASLGFTVGDDLIDTSLTSGTSIPNHNASGWTQSESAWSYGKPLSAWSWWAGNGTPSATVSADNTITFTSESTDGVIVLPTLPSSNYVFSAKFTVADTADAANGSFGLFTNLDPAFASSIGATMYVEYVSGHSNANGTNNVYVWNKASSNTGKRGDQTFCTPSGFTSPGRGSSSVITVYCWNGVNYFYIDGQYVTSIASNFTTSGKSLAGIFNSGTQVDVTDISVKALVADTTSGDAEIIGTSGNFTMYKGESLLAYDFTQSTLADGTLPEGFNYGGANATPALGWGWGASSASVSAKMATYNGTKTLQFSATNCDALLAAPAVNTRDYVYEITFIPTTANNYIGISNQTWGTDTLSSSQWFAVQASDTPYYKYKGTDEKGGIGETHVDDTYRTTAGEEVTLKVVSYSGVNYYFINDRYVTSVSHLGALGTNQTTDRVGIYTYAGTAYIKSINVNAISVTEDTLPDGVGLAGDIYYIEGDVIYENDFDDETVGSLPEGWSYGWPYGTGETKTSYGWGANTSATASAAVVDHATHGKVVQFGSTNTDAFLALPATGTMNYVYEATIVANTSNNNSIGIANNFYGSTDKATGAMYTSIYGNGATALYQYRGGGTNGQWSPSFNYSNGETINLKIVSLSGNNYIYYNDTLVAVAPWRTGGSTALSDNPGFYTYNGNMYVTDVKVTEVLTADIDFDAMRVVVNEDETVDLEIEFSFDKTQDVYAQYISGDYSSTANENFKLGYVMITGDSDVSADLTVDTDDASSGAFNDQHITQDSEKVYVKIVGRDMPETLYHTYISVRPYVYINGLYFYGDGGAYTGANLANGAYMTADTEAQKALVEKVLGECEEFVVGSGSKELTFTLFSDFHYKAGMYSTSMADLRSILKRADDTNSAFIMSGGDMCNDLIGSPELTNTYLNYVTAEGEILTAYNIYGNHELESANNSMSFVTPKLTNDSNVVWGTADGKIAADGSIAYYYFEENGFRIVCLDNNYNWNPNHINGVEVGWEHYLTNSYGGASAATNAKRGFDEGTAAVANTKGGSLGDVQMAWLEKVLLDAADKDIPCIVVAHAGYSGLGFGGGSSDAAEVRAVYAKANAANPGTVLMSINGHIHTNNQGWNEGVFYMDTNTVRNNWWQGSGSEHYTAEHTYMYEEYDAQGNLISITEKSLNTLSQARNTWFSEDPLSCVITINDAGVVTIDGMESKWAYDVVPEAASTVQGCECRISSGTFWNCDLYGHIEDYVIDGDKHYVKCTAYECDYTSASYTHTFDQEVATSDYLANRATCNDAATYYYSCVCGAKGTETFSYGSSNGHDEADEWTKDNEGHWHACANCTDKLDYAVHTYDQQVKSAQYVAGTVDCNSPATYYYSCVCGAKGTETFSDGSALGHDPADKWSTDAAGHWHACLNGCTDKLDYATHTFDQKVEDEKYMVTDKTCTTGAIYNYSCVCGVAGTTTFEGEETDDHTAADEWSSDATHHWHACTGGCTELLDKAEHTYDKQVATEDYLASNATCEEKATYYYSCVCGAKGTETFESGELDDHSYGEWTVTKEATETEKGSRVRECSVCGDKQTEDIPVQSTEEKPQTGDTFNPIIWMAVLLLSGSILSFTVAVRRRRRHN